MSAVVPTRPLEADPGEFLPGRSDWRSWRACWTGIELVAGDLRIVGWLSGLDTSKALTIASLIARARVTAIPAPVGMIMEQDEGFVRH